MLTGRAPECRQLYGMVEFWRKVNELVAALPAGDEERDKLIAEMRAPQPNPPLLRQILQFIIVKKAGEEIVRPLARQAMEVLSKWMSG